MMLMKIILIPMVLLFILAIMIISSILCRGFEMFIKFGGGFLIIIGFVIYEFLKYKRKGDS